MAAIGDPSDDRFDARVEPGNIATSGTYPDPHFRALLCCPSNGCRLADVRNGTRGGKNIRVDDSSQGWDVRVLVRAAERLDSLADTAELMGDNCGADRLRVAASSRRLQAMALLDD